MLWDSTADRDCTIRDFSVNHLIPPQLWNSHSTSHIILKSITYVIMELTIKSIFEYVDINSL